MIIKPYSPDDAIKLCGDESKRPDADLNQSAGPAYSVFLDKKLICCGGVRIYGVGEAWLLTTDQNRKEHTKTILRASQQQLDLAIRENHLWRLWAWAEMKNGEGFLEHLGFKPMKAFVR